MEHLYQVCSLSKTIEAIHNQCAQHSKEAFQTSKATSLHAIVLIKYFAKHPDEVMPRLRFKGLNLQARFKPHHLPWSLN